MVSEHFLVEVEKKRPSPKLPSISAAKMMRNVDSADGFPWPMLGMK